MRTHLFTCTRVLWSSLSQSGSHLTVLCFIRGLIGSDELCSNSNEYSRSSKITLESERDWLMLWRERRDKRERERMVAGISDVIEENAAACLCVENNETEDPSPSTHVLSYLCGC